MSGQRLLLGHLTDFQCCANTHKKVVGIALNLFNYHLTFTNYNFHYFLNMYLGRLILAEVGILALPSAQLAEFLKYKCKQTETE